MAPQNWLLRAGLALLGQLHPQDKNLATALLISLNDDGLQGCILEDIYIQVK
jgi:hypothetical protein